MKGSCIAVGLLLIAATAGAVDVPVSMVDFAFSPDSITISPGDVVVWTNNGVYVHTSTSGVSACRTAGGTRATLAPARPIGTHSQPTAVFPITACITISPG